MKLVHPRQVGISSFERPSLRKWIPMETLPGSDCNDLKVLGFKNGMNIK